MSVCPATAPDTGAGGFNRRLVRGLAGVLGCYVLYMSGLSSLNHDELEAVHTAWKILQGELLYVDFFQHHHPLLYVYLAPVIALCGQRAATVVACRIAILPFFFGIVAATWLLALRLFDKRTALVAAACLLLSWPFLYEATQIRPDVPQVMFGMFALVMLYPRNAATVADPAKTRQLGNLPHVTLRRWVMIGLCLGISFLFLQKAIFYFAAVTLVLLVRIFGRPRPRPCVHGARHGARRGARDGWTALVALGAGIAIAVLPFGIWLTVHGMVRQYFFLNWTLNAYCLDHVAFAPIAIAVVETQPAVCAFALLAFVSLARERRHGQLALVAAVLFSLVPVAPARYLYYWLPVLPLLAIYAAHGMIRILGSRPAILGGILAASGLAPVIVEIYLGEATNLGQLGQIAYVLEEAGPADPVYDGDIRFNVFRNDIDYFWFSLGDKQMLRTYQSLCPYDLDLCDRIDKIKPKIISTFQIADLADARIHDHYVPSERCPAILVRIRIPHPSRMR
jgi:hypothetical protein